MGPWGRLLALFLPAPERDWVLDDLAEERERRQRDQGEAAARRWYRREVIRSLAPALGMRLRRPRRGRERPAFLPPTEPVLRELRLAARRLARAPGFSAAAALTLALGIGATVAIFALVDGVLLRPLPYLDPERLVVIRHAAPGLGPAGAEMSEGTYLHYRSHARSFQEMAIWQEAFVNLDGPDGAAERAVLVLATPTLLPLLGVSPLLGPGFDEEDRGGRSVLLSHGLWLRRWGGDPAVVGRTTSVNGVPRRVAGVMPPGFDFPRPGVDLWMDLGLDAAQARVTSFDYQGAARLRPAVSLERAQGELERLAATLEGEFTDAMPERLAALGLAPRAVPMRDDLVAEARATLWLLLGAVAFLLLVAGANVANLHLVRAEARRREVVVRAAIGARRRDLAGHVLAESVLLAALGGALGTAAAWIAVRAFVLAAPVELPRLQELALDGRTLAFAGALALLAGTVSGLVPAVGAFQTGGSADLRAAGRTLSRSPARQRSQRALVAVQVALALTLVVGSALLVRTSWELSRVELGFDPGRILTFEVTLPYRGYETHQRGARLQLELLDSLRAIPGVASAGAVGGLPMTGTAGGSAWTAETRFLAPLEVEGRPPGEDDPDVRVRAVTDGYFETLGVPVLAGRAPARDGQAGAGATVLLSRSLAARLFPGESPLGRRLRRAGSEGVWCTVAGVVGDVRDDGAAAPAPEVVYVPLTEAPGFQGAGPGYLAFALRSGAPPASLAGAVRRALSALDPGLPAGSVRTLEEIVRARTAGTRFATLLLLAAGVSAAFLGAVGLYGVISHAVGQRRREIGVRVALGARPDEVVRLVLVEGLVLVGGGLAAGVVTAALLTGFLRHLLFEVSPTDPLAFAAAASVLLLVAALATLLPARRAAAISPVEALASD